MILTQRELKELLRYNKTTGLFTWRVSLNKRIRVGDVAGGNTGRGYIAIRLWGVKFLAHRLVWLYVHGYWPAEEIDHVDGDGCNNRFRNLREATRGENMQNRRGVSASKLTSPLLGVSKNYRQSGKPWRARIMLDKKEKALGLFDTQKEAHAAYLKAKKSIHRFGPL